MKGMILLIIGTMIVCLFAVALEQPTWPAIVLISCGLILAIAGAWLVLRNPPEVIGEELEPDIIDNNFLIQFWQKQRKKFKI